MKFATITAGRDAFLPHCNNERGPSKNTIDAYGQDIDVFILFVKGFNQETVLSGVTWAPSSLQFSGVRAASNDNN